MQKNSTNLYENYYSKFKSKEYLKIQSQLSRTWRYWDIKFMHLIKKLDRNSEILELGCGIGLFLQYLINLGYKNVTGIDISSEQIKIAENQELPVFEADAIEFLSNTEKKYDVIIAIDFIEHFHKDEIIQLFNMINYSLKTDGFLILQTPNGQGLFPNQVIYGDFSHVTIFSVDSLRYVLRLTGFQNIQFFETGPIPINLFGKIRVSLWWVIKLFINMIRLIETGKTQEIWTENFICICNKI